jgi:hypothetical protein
MALTIAVGMAASGTVQAASSDTRDLHDKNKTKASSTSNRVAHDERIRKANDRALAVLSPSPQATTALSPSPQTSISTPSWTSSDAALALYLFFGFLGLGIFVIVGDDSGNSSRSDSSTRRGTISDSLIKRFKSWSYSPLLSPK